MSSLTSTSQAESLAILMNGPAGSPPPGITPNFDNRSDINRLSANAILGICVGLSTLAVAIRTYVKLILLRSMAWEDYIILGAWTMQIAFVVITFKALSYGSGVHMWNLRLKDFIEMLYWVDLFVTICAPVICLIKEAILLQYIRIFIPNRRGDMRLYIVIQALIWIILLFYLSTFIFALAKCQPREKAWNLLMKGGHCANANVSERVSGIFNIVSDFALLLLPMVPIWELQMPFKKRLLLMVLFGIGLGACITSIMRTYYTFKYIPSKDFSFHLLLPGLWAWGELSMGTIVFCMPVLPKFWQHAHTKLLGTFAHVTSYFAPQGSSKSNEAVRDENPSSKPIKHWFDRHTKTTEQSLTREESFSNESHPEKQYIELREIERVNIRTAQEGSTEVTAVSFLG